MTHPELTFISLFAGIGGIDLGLGRAGMRCVAQVEINDYCNRVLQKHWPDVPRFKDVRDVGAHNLPPADVIAGGFPCQDISNAGKRAGITGARSGLWFEFARIVRELRPRYVLVENVSALLHRGFGRVLGDLAALRYDAEWQCLRASDLGAPHIRERVFVLGYADSSRQSGTCLYLRPGQQEQTKAVACGDGADVANANCAWGAGAAGQIPTRRHIIIGRRPSGHAWRVEPNVGRVAHGIPARVDRLRGLGNAVVPQVAEFVGRSIVAHYEGNGNASS